jgi:hypothetical protein
MTEAVGIVPLAQPRPARGCAGFTLYSKKPAWTKSGDTRVRAVTSHYQNVPHHTRIRSMQSVIAFPVSYYDKRGSPA